jgi:hypothetical protein
MVVLGVVNAECCKLAIDTKCRHAECQYAEFHYTECIILIVMSQTPCINKIDETKKEKFVSVKRSSLVWLITYRKSIYLKET